MREHLFYLTNFTNNEIEKAVNSIINTTETKNTPINCFHIGELIMSITDETLLWNTISLLKNKGIYVKSEQPILKLYKATNTPKFTAVAALRIKAICYGIFLKYECYYNIFYKYTTHFPQLHFQVNDGVVISNLDEIMEEVNADYIKFIKNSIKELTIEKQIEELKKTIRTMAEISIDFNTDEFKIHIERLTALKENLPEKEVDIESEEINPHQNKIWFEFGLLVAQGQIIQRGNYYYFEGIEFDSEQSVSLHIATNTLKLKKPKSLRPYFNATFSRVNKENDKNIYGYKKVNIIYNYCNRNKISMCSLFIEKQKTAKRY